MTRRFAIVQATHRRPCAQHYRPDRGRSRRARTRCYGATLSSCPAGSAQLCRYWRLRAFELAPAEHRRDIARRADRRHEAVFGQHRFERGRRPDDVEIRLSREHETFGTVARRAAAYLGGEGLRPCDVVGKRNSRCTASCARSSSALVSAWPPDAACTPFWIGSTVRLAGSTAPTVTNVPICINSAPSPSTTITGRVGWESPGKVPAVAPGPSRPPGRNSPAHDAARPERRHDQCLRWQAVGASCSNRLWSGERLSPLEVFPRQQKRK